MDLVALETGLKQIAIKNSPFCGKCLYLVCGRIDCGLKYSAETVEKP